MLVIQYRLLSELTLLPDNPRYANDKGFSRLCDSIKRNPELFEARPLLLSDRLGHLVIIAGNRRYNAAIHNGLKEAPTILLSGLTEAKEREIIIRDNVNNGDWNFDILANNWEAKDLADWGVIQEDWAQPLDSPKLPKSNLTFKVKCSSEEELETIKDLLEVIKPQVSGEDLIRALERA